MTRIPFVAGQFLLVLMTTAFGLGSPPEAEARPPAAAFSTLPEHDAVELSPSGRYAAAKVYMDGQYVLVIYDLDNLGVKPPVVATPKDMEVNWLRWKTDDRLLVSLWFAARRWGTATEETRLHGIDPDGKNVKFLVPPKKDEDPVQIADRVVSFLPRDPDHILMAFNPQDVRLPRLYRVNVHNARRALVELGDSGIFWWHADQAGEPRIGEGLDDSKMLSRLFLRPPGSDDWRLHREGHVDEVPGFEPILFDAEDPDLVYVRSGHEGDTLGVFRFRLSTGQFVDKVFRHEDVDVGGWTLDPTGTRLEAVHYTLDEGRTHWLNPRGAAILAEVAERVAARHLDLVSASTDYRRVIIYAESPDYPPRYYLYEPATRNLRYFAYAFPQLNDVPMGGLWMTRYPARDGLKIPAYVTLPPGLTGKPSRPLPTVVFPHGGPVARDMAAFDPLVQFMASRGYVVLQMNFRGSWGYGAEFRQAGAREWGQAMQDDVTDGTRWLVQEGVADPERICIVGWSYGGYAALMGAVKEPDLYRCAASIAGVSDLQALLAQGSDFLFHRTFHRHIGQSWKDRRMLAENSPVNRAAEIRAPVLLIHGTKDRQVPAAQSSAMARALAREKKPHEHLELKDADHSVLRGTERLQLFQSLEAFLGRHLEAGKAPPQASADPAP